jgi:putative ABC transport system ATP-binding protein
MTEAVSLEHIRKSVHTPTTQLDILQDLSLSVEKGDFVAITGPSGSGKSTLLQIIGLLDAPTEGNMRLLGEEVRALDSEAKAHFRANRIGFIFQMFHLVNHLTVRENIALPRQYSKKPGDPKDVDRLMERFHLQERSTAYPATLSGGEKQRVAIARSLVNAPDLLLADEPTGALDSTNGQEVLEVLKSLNREGKTILLITHDLTWASHARRILKLKDGAWDSH